MSRREFSRRTKLSAFDRTGGCCEGCGRKLFPGDRTEYDHIIPCELGGSNEPENCQVLCGSCHAEKTAVDQKTFAKARSVRAKHTGAKVTKSPLPGSRASKWRRKLNGEVEPRVREEVEAVKEGME